MKADPLPVLVVGGGPAGATTALLLARAGVQVELVDRARFPRGKACGECLNPGGVAALERLGLLPAVLATHPAPLDGWELHRPTPRSCGAPAIGRFARGDVGLGIARAVLDDALLHEARRAGARVREGVRLVGVDPGDARRPAEVHLVDSDGTTHTRRARILVGADGLHSRVGASVGLALPTGTPRRASLSWRVRGAAGPRLRGRLVMGHGFTVGLAPVGPADAGGWNATLVVDPELHPGILPDGGWDLLARTVAAMAEWDGKASDLEQVEGPWGAGSFRRPVRRAHSGRVALVGDAAGYFDPLTGQGIYRALRSAELAASSLLPHLRGADPGAPRSADLTGLARYGRRLRRALLPGRTLQRAVERVVSHPRARPLALGALARAPALASGLVRLVGDRPGTLLPLPRGRPPRA